MVKRLAIAVLLVLGVASTVVHLPAQSCTMAMPIAAASCDCCATMKSCVLPQKDRTPPATANAAEHQTIALSVPEIQSVPLQSPVASATFNSSAREALRDSTPRLAVLCTFLI